VAYIALGYTKYKQHETPKPTDASRPRAALRTENTRREGPQFDLNPNRNRFVHGLARRQRITPGPLSILVDGVDLVGTISSSESERFIDLGKGSEYDSDRGARCGGSGRPGEAHSKSRRRIQTRGLDGRITLGRGDIVYVQI